MRKARYERAKAESDTAERARAWDEAKAREKAEITRITAESREKVELEAKATARSKEKDIAAKRVAAETGAEARIRVEAKAELNDLYVGILMDVLNNVKDESNRLKRAMVGSE